MPKVEGTYSHSMTKEEAVDASKKAIAKLLASFEATETLSSSSSTFDAGDWVRDEVGFSCLSRGMKISGKIFIYKDEVKAIVDLPMMAFAFKGLVQAAIDKHIPKHLKKGVADAD
jgi:hypothetical protein|tara:strand:- start:19 stop:363 length:345 start_codon:yes stop_codon:yes gene_type:complete